MRAQKFAIAISEPTKGKYTIQILAVDGDKVVGSDPDHEYTELSWYSATLKMAEMAQNLAWRLTRNVHEFVVPEKVKAKLS